MRSVILALGSFIVGACCMFAISAGIQTSTWAQSAASSPCTKQPLGAQLEMGSRSGLLITGAVPTIPGLAPEMKKIELTSDVQILDGVNCVNCTLVSPHLVYGGGAFRLPNSTLTGVITLQLVGAPLNGAALAVQLGMLQPPKKVEPPHAFETPHKFKASTDSTMKTVVAAPTAVTLISAVGAP